MPISPVESVPLIAPTPLLIVHGDQDGYFPVDHPRMLAAASGGHAELWIEHGMGHAEHAADDELLAVSGHGPSRRRASLTVFTETTDDQPLMTDPCSRKTRLRNEMAKGTVRYWAAAKAAAGIAEEPYDAGTLAEALDAARVRHPENSSACSAMLLPHRR